MAQPCVAPFGGEMSPSLWTNSGLSLLFKLTVGIQLYFGKIDGLVPTICCSMINLRVSSPTTWIKMFQFSKCSVLTIFWDSSNCPFPSRIMWSLQDFLKALRDLLGIDCCLTTGLGMTTRGVNTLSKNTMILSTGPLWQILLCIGYGRADVLCLLKCLHGW